ncbi:hypothetical protein GCM10017557_20000 [Streptomyces aurantiacus]|uniref:Uncharacterized protein n=1 Tax=Streptomyces aurantiacus TaxID=47760 RepID=A0A7G1NXK5_9ACTN|nr:hypothetical protein GCM10017557_20000 [Streptomyces aurantiacus]
MTDGTVTPCVLGRFLPTGNAKTDGLAVVFGGRAPCVQPASRTRPKRTGPVSPGAVSLTRETGSETMHSGFSFRMCRRSATTPLTPPAAAPAPAAMPGPAPAE